MYFLIRNTTLDTKARMVQYKVLYNILYANKMLFKFGKVTPTRCSFCKLHDETIMHLFYDCLIVKKLWNQLKSILSNNLNFPISTPQSAIFGFWDLDTNEHLKPLATYFQNVHLQCKNNGLLEYKHLFFFVSIYTIYTF